MRKLILLCVLLCAAPMSLRAAESPRYTQLHILYTNDAWGHLFPFRWNDMDDIGGVERRATLVRRIKAESKYPVLLLDASDIYMGGPLENLLGEPDIAAMNAIGYDAAVVGDWDFADTRKGYAPYPASKKARFPLLCANLLWSGSREPVLRPWTVVSAGTLRVAIFGLIQSTYKWDGMETDDQIQVARELVPKLKREADVVVAITHMSYAKSRELAAAVPDIDVIVGGGFVKGEPSPLDAPVVISSSNDHDPFWIGGPVIVQDGRFGTTLGHLALNLRKSDQQGFRVMSCSVRLEKVDNAIPPAKDITAILKRFSAPFDKPIGRCTRDLVAHPQRGDELEVWVAEVMRRIAHADVCAHAYDANISLRKGAVTRLDVMRMIPHSTKLMRVIMTPAQYQKAIDGCEISISGTIPPGAEKIAVAADGYFATHLTAAGGKVDFEGKPVNSELIDYIASRPSVGDEVASTQSVAK